jgi:hypothetical protein
MLMRRSDDLDAPDGPGNEVLDLMPSGFAGGEVSEAGEFSVSESDSIPDTYSLILIDNEVPGGSKMACIVNMHRSAIFLFNDRYYVRKISTSESAIGYNSFDDVCDFIKTLYTLSAKSEEYPKAVSGLSCRLMEPLLVDPVLYVRLLYYKASTMFSQWTGWGKLQRWSDESERDEELAAWAKDLGVPPSDILSLLS